MRRFSLIDQFLMHVDRGLRTLSPQAHIPERANPATTIEQTKLTPSEQRHSAGLMRVNLAGEVSAQALYQGQALTARSKQVRETMQHSAREEEDHLAWCAEQLNYLNGHPSYLNPLWYSGSWLLGVIAGLISDRWSLGFVAETEKQVVEHLDDHLQNLPASDQKSRAILTQMRQDEAGHAHTAVAIGAAELPQPIKMIMRILSKFMTKTAYWI